MSSNVGLVRAVLVYPSYGCLHWPDDPQFPIRSSPVGECSSQTSSQRKSRAMRLAIGVRSTTSDGCWGVHLSRAQLHDARVEHQRKDRSF